MHCSKLKSFFRRSALWMVLFSSSLAHPAGAIELTDPGRAFKEYVAGTPAIKHIVFEQSHMGKFGPGYVLADGAIQPEGFYLRFSSNSPVGSNMIVWGSSAEYEWEYAADWKNVCYGPKHFSTNYFTSMNASRAVLVATVAYLGLPCALDGGVIWTSQSNFSCRNLLGEYAGSITAFEGNRVIEIEYRPTQKSKNPRTCRVTYQYNHAGDFPPTSFVVETTTPDNALLVTNNLHSLDIGMDDRAEAGFHMTNFVPPAAEIANIFFVSNGTRFSVRPDGAMVKYRYSNEFERRSHPVQYAIAFAVLVMVATTAAFLLRRRGL